MKEILEKIKIATYILIIATIITAIGNTIQTYVKSNLEPVSLLDSLYGTFIVFFVAILGYIISQIPYLRKMSPVFWVGIVGVVLSTPGVPFSDFIVKKTSIIQFAALGTPTLAYAGLALGKDLPILKKLSWKILIVGFAVILGTFLCATIVSQILLKIEGVI